MKNILKKIVEPNKPELYSFSAYPRLVPKKYIKKLPNPRTWPNNYYQIAFISKSNIYAFFIENDDSPPKNVVFKTITFQKEYLTYEDENMIIRMCEWKKV